MPLVLIQVVLFDIVVYLYVLLEEIHSISRLTHHSMANLSRTASQFFINLLFLFVLTMTIYSFFRAVGALCPSLDVGT